MNLIPPIGTKGLYRLLTPFDQAMIAGFSYTCMAVRRLQDVIASGFDPEAMFYTPHGLTTQQYQDDLDNRVCIVSLRADDGTWVYVPSSFIASYPDLNGVPYSSVALLVYLSALPDSQNLEYLKDRVSELVFDNLGVTTTIQTLVTSPATLVSQADHAAIENARQLKVRNRTTDQARLLEVTRQRDLLQIRVQALERYILDTNVA